MTREEMLEAAKTLFKELVSGENPDDVADIMGWDSETFAKVKKAMLSSNADDMRSKPSEHVYIEYLIEQRRNVKDLTDLINNLDDKRQYNAVVGAIRLRSEIVDRILERGFDFGVLKRAESRQGSGAITLNYLGINLGDMTAPQLRDAIGAQLKELEGLMGKFGDGVGITTLSPGALHYGKAVTVPTLAETASGDKSEVLGKPKKRSEARKEA